MIVNTSKRGGGTGKATLIQLSQNIRLQRQLARHEMTPNQIASIALRAELGYYSSRLQEQYIKDISTRLIGMKSLSYRNMKTMAAAIYIYKSIEDQYPEIGRGQLPSPNPADPNYIPFMDPNKYAPTEFAINRLTNVTSRTDADFNLKTKEDILVYICDIMFFNDKSSVVLPSDIEPVENVINIENLEISPSGVDGDD